MPKIKLQLLDCLNEKNRGDKTKSLIPKYIIKVTAAEINSYIKYQFSGKKHPIKLEPDSTIVLDNEVQRGLTDEGKLRQEMAKIGEIRDTLLGVGGAKKAFLGSLVWNVRDAGSEGFQVYTRQMKGKPPEYELEFDADNIFLTDSAHRHFGIAEAYKQFKKNPKEYPAFEQDFEFVVELYNLSRTEEKSLFNELNSKQKKITASKAKQMDVTSPIGVLKDKIIKYDADNEGLFHQNIEVNSNQNDRHTLITMGVFTSSIKDMFGAAAIKSASDDDDLASELAEFYCQFFYKLKSEIKVKCTVRGREVEVVPFASLYKEIIKPVEDQDIDDEEVFEDKLKTAREKATSLNKAIREEDKTNSNPIVRGLCKIAGRMRLVSTWERMVEKLQSDLIAAEGGRYFQASNKEMYRRQNTGHAIGSRKDENDTLNIQVQSHVLKTIEVFLAEKLEILREPYVELEHQGDKYPNRSGSFGKVFILNRDLNNWFDLRLTVCVGSGLKPETSNFFLKIEPVGCDWKQAKFTGKKRLQPIIVEKSAGYTDGVYPDGVEQYIARFEIDVPPFDMTMTDKFSLKLILSYPDLSGDQLSNESFVEVQSA